MAGTRYRKRTIKDTEYWFTSNWQNIILLLFLCSGIVIGVVIVRDSSADPTSDLHAFFSGFIQSRREADFFTRLLASLAGSLPFFLGTVLLALSVPGAFLIPFLTIFRAMGAGFIMGYFYRFGGGQGMGYALLLLLPHILISTVVFLSVSGESMRLSAKIFRRMFVKETETEAGMVVLRKYFMKQSMYLLFIGLSCVLDVCLGLCFDRFFEF